MNRIFTKTLDVRRAIASIAQAALITATLISASIHAAQASEFHTIYEFKGSING